MVKVVGKLLAEVTLMKLNRAALKVCYLNTNATNICAFVHGSGLVRIQISGLASSLLAPLGFMLTFYTFIRGISAFSLVFWFTLYSQPDRNRLAELPFQLYNFWKTKCFLAQ